MRDPSDAIVRSGRMRVGIARASCVRVGLIVALGVAVMVRCVGAAAVPESDAIAFRLLAMEAEVVSVSEPVRRELRELLEAAATEVLRRRDGIRRHRAVGPSAEGWDRDAVIDALRAIDDVLGRRGYLHPIDDRVDLLSEGLTPAFLGAAEREALLKLPRNARRVAQMEARFPGPFRFLDCDTATAVHLGVAERLDLPLRMVYSPSRNRQRGHVWVRWGKGARRLDWETTQGALRTGFEWGAGLGRGSPKSGRGPAGSGLEIELEPTQVVGAWHYLVAVQHERRGEVEMMLHHLEQALAVFPGHLDARRQLAWNFATLPNISAERVRTAVTHAREVVRLSGDADSRDTLAAALAAGGDFRRAIREERAAIADPAAPDAARRGYRQRLALYEAGQEYRQRDRRPSATVGVRDASPE